MSDRPIQGGGPVQWLARRAPVSVLAIDAPSEPPLTHQGDGGNLELDELAGIQLGSFVSWWAPLAGLGAPSVHGDDSHHCG